MGRHTPEGWGRTREKFAEKLGIDASSLAEYEAEYEARFETYSQHVLRTFKEKTGIDPYKPEVVRELVEFVRGIAEPFYGDPGDLAIEATDLLKKIEGE